MALEHPVCQQQYLGICSRIPWRLALTQSRHGVATDNGGHRGAALAWLNCSDNGTISYDQMLSGVMVGLDSKLQGRNTMR